MLQPSTSPRGHGDAGVEVEAGEVRLARADRADPWRVGVATDTQDGLPFPRARRHSSEDRRAAEPGQRWRLVGKGVVVVDLLRGTLEVDSVAPREPDDTSADRGKEARHL